MTIDGYGLVDKRIAASKLARVTRHRAFLTAMTRLALAATLLMAFAPVVSRWTQSLHAAEAAGRLVELCTPQGLKSLLLPSMDAAASQLVHAVHDAGHGAAGGGHEGHGGGIDCDYCLLAARVLPCLALLFLLLPLPPVAAAAMPLRIDAPRSLAWPAHAPRGPPAFS